MIELLLSLAERLNCAEMLLDRATTDAYADAHHLPSSKAKADHLPRYASGRGRLKDQGCV
jgi:hypothetical protein